jgi:cell filamentation protein
MAKEGFPFAAASLVPRLLDEYEKKFLTKFTPCDRMDDEQLLEALAHTHLEYILIHPFREGNGRLGRVLSTIMALQAGKPLLDFTYMILHKDEYIRAIHAGLDNIAPMKELFRRVLQQGALPNGGG